MSHGQYIDTTGGPPEVVINDNNFWLDSYSARLFILENKIVELEKKIQELLQKIEELTK